MKRVFYFGIVLAFLTACGGVKKTQKAVNAGNYDRAIQVALDNLVRNKTKKANQPYVELLEEAFGKYTRKELARVAFWEKEENPANYEDIYNTYQKLWNVQERIKPLLPLYLEDEGREAHFRFRDFSDDLVDAKDQLSEYLYDTAVETLERASDKASFRKAYDDLAYLEQINPGFEDTRQKMEEAHAKGLDYVKVVMVNHTDQILPARLEQELLNFNTYGLNDFWTEYHANPLAGIEYDYSMDLAFRSIDISPEHVREKEIIKERQIKDGYQYATDREGNVVRDSLGNRIKIDKFRTVRCNYYEFVQHKEAQVNGLVAFTDLRTKQQINSYPLTSAFVFEHIYADYDGDKRALDNDLTPFLELGAVPFPTNEQMVYDAGEDLKLQLKSILSRQMFN